MISETNEKLKLFSNCIPVNGFCRSLVCDIQRHQYHFIPNSLYEILTKFDGKSIFEIKKAYNNQYDIIIDEYLDFLIEKEFIFFTEEPEVFPRINLEWDSPSLITNSIICDNKSNHDYVNIFTQLDQLNCKALQLRFFNLNSITELINILNKTKNLRLQDIEIMMPYIEPLDLEGFKSIIEKHLRISKFFIFSSPFDKIEFVDHQKGHPVIYTTNRIVDHSFCGKIHPNNFVQNISFFTESQDYNTCLNRKICIDEYGEIKNCPSMSKTFGNIKNTSLKEAIKKEEFKSCWTISKNDIEVCKDCEFRYLCMDCRAYIKDAKNSFSQPSKCFYNPYIAKWKGQEDYISVEDYLEEQKMNKKTV